MYEAAKDTLLTASTAKLYRPPREELSACRFRQSVDSLMSSLLEVFYVK